MEHLERTFYFTVAKNIYNCLYTIRSRHFQHKCYIQYFEISPLIITEIITDAYTSIERKVQLTGLGPNIKTGNLHRFKEYYEFKIVVKNIYNVSTH